MQLSIRRLMFGSLGALILAMLASCSDFQKRHAAHAYRCGAEVQAGEPWHQIHAPDGTLLNGHEMDVVPLQAGESRTRIQAISSLGCASLPAEQSWLITARDRQLYRIVRSNELQPYMPVFLEPSPEQSVQVRCPSGPIPHGTRPSDLLVLRNVRNKEVFELSWSIQGENGATAPGFASLVTLDEEMLLDQLGDGTYQLNLTLTDRIAGRSESTECSLTLDSQSPLIQVSSASSSLQKIQGHDVLTLPRDEVLRFSATHPAATDKVEYCFEKMQTPGPAEIGGSSGCKAEHLRTAFINDAVSPMENRGFWRLQYRGLDEAGNSSGWQEPQVILYTDQKALDDLKQAGRADVLQFLYNDGLGLAKILRETLYQFKNWQSLVTDHEKDLGRPLIYSQLNAAYVSMNINGPMLVSPVPMNTVLITRDGKKVIAGHFNGDVRIWNSSSGELLATLPGWGRSLGDLAFSQDEKYLVTVSFDLSVRKWDLETYSELASFTCCNTNAVGVRVAISPDQKHIVTTSWDKEIKIWNFEGQLERTISAATTADFHTGSIMSVKVTPDSQWVATGAGDGSVRFWNINTGEFVKKLGATIPAAINAIAITPDGERVIYGGTNGQVHINSINDGSLERTIEASAMAIYSVDVSANGILASYGEDRMVRLWDIKTGKLVEGPRKVEDASMDEVAISESGQTVVASTNSNTLRIWDRSIGNRLVKSFSPENTQPAIRSLLINPTNHAVLAGGADGSLFEWNSETNEASRQKIHNDTIYDLAWDPVKPVFYSASKDGTLKSWDSSLGIGPSEPWTLPGKWIYSIASSSDGRYMMIGTFTGEIIIRDVDQGTEKMWTPHTNWTKVLYDETSGLFISFSWDKSIRLWNPVDQSLVKTFAGAENPINTVALSPDRRYLYAGLFNGRVNVWDVQAPESPRSFDTNGQNVWDLMISPDGSTLVTGTHDGNLRFYDTATLRPMGIPIPAHKRPVRALVMDALKKRFYSAGDDGVIKVWNIPFGQDVLGLRQQICQQIAPWVDSEWFNPDRDPKYQNLCRDSF
ncbi:MAG: WD40 repeat domain-containing protein [Pseudobdellovibrionaceae bacterium]|nr:WD40 repeat domain-containing protein [Pseudobdellovibrionaceae bacterium]